MEKIVVTGGTGLIGQALLPILKVAGYDATAIRRPYTADALKGADAIINLAGENLSAGRWTKKRKLSIIQSRVQTLDTLRELLKKENHTVKTLISASATGFYGTITTGHIFTEQDLSGSDFLAGVCREWESAADSFQSMGIRVVKIRTGVVLSEKGGALPKLMMPLKFGVSVPLGTGNQWLPWIHIDDLVQIFLHLLQNGEFSGAYNAVAPNPVTNRELMQQLAIKKHRFFIPIGVPAFLLKAILGEMAVVTLEGSRVSAARIMAAGFAFKYPELYLG